VNAELSALSARLQQVRRSMTGAAARSGRDPATVRLVAVVKTVPLELVREGVRLGLSDLGESRVQEAEARIADVGRASEGGPIRWHMVGHLQSNKAGRAARLFDRVHALDDLELARHLSRHARAAGREVAVMIEVNVTGAPQRFGVAPGGLADLVRGVAGLPALALDGVMAVGPVVPHPEAARPGFAAVRELRDRAARETGVELPQLSMGMSDDYEVAIEEGSTMVRIGTALFGKRTPATGRP
jgi:pyridoxal phosphate enzyme (YggS family)